jgi:hypothetical protein
MHFIMQSQHAWIMAQQSLSPLVQVMQTPSGVSVHLHMPITMLHWHIIRPFIMQEQLHMPSQSILHMFCKVAALISSSQVQVIFIPPVHFSIFISQRGTMHIWPMFGIMPGVIPVGMPVGMPLPCIEPIIIERSNIMTLDILNSFVWVESATCDDYSTPERSLW